METLFESFTYWLFKSMIDTRIYRDLSHKLAQIWTRATYRDMVTRIENKCYGPTLS